MRSYNQFLLLKKHRHVEALLLKGNVLLSMKKLQDSMNHFREAVAIAPYRYETHKGLVDCYLEQARHREAVRYAFISLQLFFAYLLHF